MVYTALVESEIYILRFFIAPQLEELRSPKPPYPPKCKGGVLGNVVPHEGGVLGNVVPRTGYFGERSERCHIAR